MRVKANRTGASFDVTADGRGLEGRAGVALPSRLADRVGLTDALCDALAGVRSWRDHEPGVVARDLAVLLIDGGEYLSDLPPRDEAVFGGQASQPTAWRTVEAIAADGGARERIATAVRGVRGHVWGLPGGAPPVLSDDEPLCLDLDATLVTAHSEKEGTAGTYKGGWGYHPNLAVLDRGDGTGEPLAGQLRPGNAGANTAADHIGLLVDALAALPPQAEGRRLVVRGDAGYASKSLLDFAVACGCEYSVSFELSEPVRAAIRAVPDAAWQPAVCQDDTVRDRAFVAELSDVELRTGWPEGMRLIVRCEPLHPGAQQTFDDIDGYRFTVLATNQPDGDIVMLERRHRARARIEDRVRELKSLGLRNLPCGSFARNAAWLELSLIALTLLTWTRALTLDGDQVRAEPHRLRYELFHTAARISRTGRRLTVHLQHDWPWIEKLLTAFQRLAALPMPAS